MSKFHLVFARVMENSIGQGIAGFIAVFEKTPGLVIGHRVPAMGIRGIPEKDVTFSDMKVVEDIIVVPKFSLKKGFAELMNAYKAERLSIGTVALGIAQRASEEARNFALNRIQFRLPIAKLFASQTAIKVKQDELQIHGSMGYPVTCRWSD